MCCHHLLVVCHDVGLRVSHEGLNEVLVREHGCCLVCCTWLSLEVVPWWCEPMHVMHPQSA